MSGRALLDRARAVGLEIACLGSNLTLEARHPPPEDLLDELRTHKREVLALVRAAKANWNGEDWLAFFEERMTYLLTVRHADREDAEREAFRICIMEWLNRNPATSRAGHCAWCQSEDAGGSSVILPFGSFQSGHVWLHDFCWKPWFSDRQEKARKALALLGLPDLETVGNG